MSMVIILSELLRRNYSQISHYQINGSERAQGDEAWGEADTYQ